MLNLRSSNRFIFIGLALLGLTVSSVNAATVNISTCVNNSAYNCITSIDGLEILGSSYDMTIITGEFGQLFSDPATDISYWGDAPFANAAQSQVDSAINGLSSPVNSSNTKFADAATDLYDNNFRLFFPTSQSFLLSIGDVFSGPCGGLRADAGYFSTSCGSWWGDRDFAFATFSPSAVPVPAAAWLFGTALIGLAGMSRRRKVAWQQSETDTAAPN